MRREPRDTAYLAMPLRAVVSRTPTNPEHTDFYQTETLECGHVYGSTAPNYKAGRRGRGDGEWVWPKRRRCWACWKATQPQDA